MFEMIKVPFFKQADTFELINLEQLQTLHNWLSTQRDGASMREIKRAIPWSKADREMELFVSRQLIERDKKTYHSLVPEISTELLAELSEQAVQLTQELHDDLLATIPTVQDNPWLITYSIARLKQQTFSRVVALPESAITPVFSTCHKSGHYLFVDADSQEDRPVGLANYFADIKETTKSQQLFAKIGDVNDHYFMEMTGKQLRLIYDGQQPRRSRGNIFIEALELLGYITEADGFKLTGELTFIDSIELNHGLDFVENKIKEALTDRREDEVEQDVLQALVFNQLLITLQGTKVVILVTSSKTSQ